MAKGKKAALRVLQLFWSSLDEDRFEAQTLDCVSVAMTFAPSLVQNFREEYLAFCKRSDFYRLPASTAFGRKFFQACITLGLVDLKKLFFGGLCSGQFGWPTQQLYSVDIRQLSVEDAEELRQTGFFHWYTADQFTTEQIAVLMSGGTIRNTFGIADVDLWESVDVFQVIED